MDGMKKSKRGLNNMTDRYDMRYIVGENSVIRSVWEISPDVGPSSCDNNYIENILYANDADMILHAEEAVYLLRTRLSKTRAKFRP